MLATVRELDIGFVAYSPLGRGFLSGEIKSIDDLPEEDWRRTWPRFSREHFDTSLRLVEKVGELAAAKGVTPSQLALAWVLAQGAVAIPGTKRRKYLEENAAATDIELTEEDLTALDGAVPVGAAAGTRYTEAGMQSLNH